MTKYIVLRTHEDPAHMLDYYMPKRLHDTLMAADAEKNRLSRKLGKEFRVLSVGERTTIRERVEEFINYWVRPENYHPESNPFKGKYIKAWNNKKKQKIQGHSPDLIIMDDYAISNKWSKDHSDILKRVEEAIAKQLKTTPMGAGESKYNKDFWGDSIGWLSLNSKAESSAKVKEEKQMSIRVTNPVFVNGSPESSLSTDQLISFIRAAKDSVKSLSEIDVESKTIKALIAKEEKGIADILVVLDGRAKDVK